MGKLLFQPGVGTDSRILSQPPVEGSVWFATDSKKIYYSDGNTFLPMGGNSSIFYGTLTFTDAPDEGQTEFVFSVLEIEGNKDISDGHYKVPIVDDLILNQDGCFYRVTEIENEGIDTIIRTEKLTIAGGGGSENGPSNVGKLEYKNITPRIATCLYNQKYSIEFTVSATDASGEITGNGSYSVEIDGKKDVIKGTCYQGKNSVEVGSYLTLKEDGNNIRIYVTMDIGGSGLTTQSILWNITATQIDLEWNNTEYDINYLDEVFNMNFTASGYQIEKTAHVIINDYLSLPDFTFTSISQQTLAINPSDWNLTHGAHKVELYITANVGGTDIRTPSIIKSLIFVDRENENPIISCNFFVDKLTQYNPIGIPYFFYQKDNTVGNLTAVLKENGTIIDTWTGLKNADEMDRTKEEEKNGYVWNYTPAIATTRTLTVQCGITEKTLILEVEPLNIDNEEIGGYSFKFKANDFSSNTAVENWNSNGVTATFSDNFDWINGGLKNEKDEKGNPRQYFCVKAGSTMTINYNMFSTNAAVRGKTFKFIFKATSCRDYDALVLDCYDDDKKIGLRMCAQNALLSGTENALDIPYCEDSYIEFEFDISATDAVKRYMIPWMDGVPAALKQYSATEQFIQNKKIVIGSDDCDVYIYLMKLYENHLSDESHLQNFIADAPNAQEMLDRFNRNDIIDPERGTISPTKLAEKNPDCRVHVYKIKRMTLNKDDKIGGCEYIQYHGSGNPVLTADDVQIRVQGTSSASYGLAAFNIDSKFNNGFVYADGSTSEGWSMNENSIPVDYFCTKVNVASAEHANNALNQEWYNRYQPYKTNLRKKNPYARDCMEFTPGVLFMEDHNEQKDFTTSSKFISNNLFAEIDNYIDDPYARMYSICNMGNSKKNATVLHDTENPIEYCVEVADNQTGWQWMTNNNYDDNTIWKNPNGFEFRYPDDGHINLDNTEAKFESPLTGELVTHRQHAFDSWRRFVNWMAASNPQPRYKVIEITSEEDFNSLVAEGTIIYTAPEDDNGLLTGAHIQVSNYEAGKKYYVQTASILGYTMEPLGTSVTYGNYEFKAGSPYTEKLTSGGTCTIQQYAGTYTHDTYEYRMAKMLSECENYLVMDSVLYHYLFIERHTMVDNVAKNTFWSTEDGYHWNMTKNYDNDTSDGNDNQGKLTLTYGIEPFDTHPDDVNDYYFNADQSVWFRFCGGLYEACKTLYKVLESTGENGDENAWSATNYLNTFRSWQKTIPERCWIEDYYRKYIRPLEIYGESMFVDMLEGGQKVHQRKQYETYHDYYTSSKYVGKTATDNRIIIRGEGTQFKSGLPVSVYADCYIQAAFGSGNTPNVSMRVKRNEPITIYVPDTLENLTNSTNYFFLPQLYQTIGKKGQSLNIFLPKQITVSPAVKLRTLIAGDYDENIINYGLEDVGFTNNVMLEDLQMCNYPNTALSLDLTGAVNLKNLDIRNSGFTGVSIADGAPIESIKLEGPGTLSLSNLRYLNTLTFNKPEQLKTLLIDNIDTNDQGINSKVDIIDQASGLTTYRLRNVEWIIDAADEISGNTINVLERILGLTPYSAQNQTEASTSASSLTGTLNVNTAVDNSLAMYERYAIELNENGQRRFPNLDIIFNNAENTLHTVTIVDGNNNIIYQRKLVPGSNIDVDFLSDSPYGAFNENNIKQSSTEYYDYTFSENWKICDTETGEYVNQYAGKKPLINNITQNITLVPQFTETTRKWNVSLWNGEVELFSGTCDAGTILQDYINANYPMIPYKDDAGLPMRSTYSFEGYALSKTATTGIDAANQEVTADMTLYAVFKEISVYDNIHEEYWDFTEVSNNAYGSSYDNDSSYYINSGYIIAPKANIGLKGKVTIPDIYDNLPVYKLNDRAFFDNSEITHVFVKGTNLRIIGESCFSATTIADGGSGTNAIKHFDFNDGLRYIERYAFQYAKYLEPINNVFNFGNNIYYISQYAFNQCFNLKGEPCTFNIAPSLKTLGVYALSNFQTNAVPNNTVSIGTPVAGSNLNLSSIPGSTGTYNETIAANPGSSISKVEFYSKLYSSADDTIDVSGAGSHTIGHLLGENSAGVGEVQVININ